MYYHQKIFNLLNTALSLTKNLSNDKEYFTSVLINKRKANSRKSFWTLKLNLSLSRIFTAIFPRSLKKSTPFRVGCALSLPG